jgi:hypothetical protein
MLYQQSTEEHVYLLFGIAQVFMGGDCMSRIIKEPVAPPRRDFMIDYSQGSSAFSFLSYRVKRSFIVLPKLADTSSEDACMVLVLASLLLTTLLLPWIVL